jgi:hypothetical protein
VGRSHPRHDPMEAGRERSDADNLVWRRARAPRAQPRRRANAPGGRCGVTAPRRREEHVATGEFGSGLRLVERCHWGVNADAATIDHAILRWSTFLFEWCVITRKWRLFRGIAGEGGFGGTWRRSRSRNVMVSCICLVRRVARRLVLTALERLRNASGTRSCAALERMHRGD